MDAEVGRTMEQVVNVYIVTSGEYSDYGIRTVFSTREKAEEWIKAWVPTEYRGSEEYRIEEYAVDAEPMPTPHIKVWMDRHGVTLKTRQYQDQGRGGYRWFENRRGGYRDGDDTLLVWVVETDDETRAIKVVNEKRAQIIALNLWGKNKDCGVMFKGAKES